MWNSMNVGLFYVSLNCYKLYWWILDNTIEDLKWCLGDSLEEYVCWEFVMYCWWSCDKTLNVIDFLYVVKLGWGWVMKGEKLT